MRLALVLFVRGQCETMLFTKRNHQSCSRTQAERACSGERQLPDSFSQCHAETGARTVYWKRVISCNGAPSLEMSISCLQTEHWNRLVPQLRIALDYVCRHGAKAGSVLMNHRSLEPARTPAALQWRGRCMAMDFECVKVPHTRSWRATQACT